MSAERLASANTQRLSIRITQQSHSGRTSLFQFAIAATATIRAIGNRWRSLNVKKGFWMNKKLARKIMHSIRFEEKVRKSYRLWLKQFGTERRLWSMQIFGSPHRFFEVKMLAEQVLSKTNPLPVWDGSAPKKGEIKWKAKQSQ